MDTSNLFNKNHNELGSLDKDLILKTRGQVRIQFGKKFVNLLNNKGQLDVKIPTIEYIKPVESTDLINSNGFYYYNGVIIAYVDGNTLQFATDASIEEITKALELKADKTEIPDVSGFATKEELPELDELFAKNAEISALKDQITVLTRALQELKTPVVETVTELPNVTTSMPDDDIKLDDVTVPETTSYNDRKSVTAKSINAENMVMESSTITLNADGDVNVTGLTSSGNLPQLLPDANNKKTNAAMSIHADGDVTIKDCTVGQSGYNTFEIGLNGGYPKNVIIDNVHFEGTLGNNAITIFGHQKNAIITISNCVFDEVSNPVRISNDTNQPATIKFINCRCDKWEEKYPDYAGFLLLQDWKSANAEEFNTNNLTITFENCYGPNGKIEGTVEELISNTNKRAMYMYCANAGGIIGYNAELFPTVITK